MRKHARSMGVWGCAENNRKGQMRLVSGPIGLAFYLVSLSALGVELSNDPREATWVTNGPVYAIATTPTTTYIGGEFYYVGPNTGSATSIDRVTGKVGAVLPKVDGIVYACAADGSGGWYIGGVFTHVGKASRSNIAHIRADGSVDSAWAPDVTAVYPKVARVLALAVSGNVVYVGGVFNSIGGQARNSMAALDATTGLATSWDPNAGGADPIVWTIAVSGDVVYVGGRFASVGGQTRSNIAALDAGSGLATEWNPQGQSPDFGVKCLALSGNLIYVGGSFLHMGGKDRSCVAALDTTTGLATDWNPVVNGEVLAVAVSGNVVFIAGSFDRVNYEPRGGLAALNASTGKVLAWDPNPKAGSHYSSIFGLAVSDGIVYVGGQFTTIGDQTRFHIAAIDSVSGKATDWDPGANDWVNTLAVSGNVVFAGGYFSSVSGRRCNCIAALDAATGEATDWNPNDKEMYSIGFVSALALSDDKVYVGGQFQHFGGVARNRVAAVDASTGAVIGWDPQAGANGKVTALAASGGVLYTGGEFTSIGGQTRNYVAALDVTTGLATAWDPNANACPISALTVSDNVVYVGGPFTSIGGQTRNYIAALDVKTGLATGWNPNADAPVYALHKSGGLVYAGGGFLHIGGESRFSIAALSASNGLATAWDPNVNTGVGCLAELRGVVYAANGVNVVGGQIRAGNAGLDATTGLATAWNPVPWGDGGISTFAVSGDTLYAAGSFSTLNGEVRPYFAQFDAPPSVSSVTGTAPATTNAASLQFTVTFSSAVSGVDASDFVLTTTGAITGASVVSVEGSGAARTVKVNTGVGNGTIRLDVLDDDTIAGAGNSLPLGGSGLGNGNFTGGAVYTIDKTRPTVTMSSTTPEFTASSPIPVAVTFSESVTGFSANGIAVGNATVTDFSGSGATYSFSLVPAGQGPVTADIGAGVSYDTATNANTAAVQFVRRYDTVGPTIHVGAPSATITSKSAVTYTISYGGADEITLTHGDVAVNTTGTARASVEVSGAGNASRTVTLSDIAGDGTLSISIAAGSAVDNAGNSAPATGASAAFTVDNTAPSVRLDSPAPDSAVATPIPVTVSFSEYVVGFTVDDVVVTNATVSNFAGSGATYTFYLVPDTRGPVSAEIPAGVARDRAEALNLAAPPLTRLFSPPPNPVDISDDGQVNAIDVQRVINKALGFAIVGDADANRDGAVDAVDVQLVINAALGLTSN